MSNATDTVEIPNLSSKRVLEPHERISEVLFGLIMVLTFTGSLSVADAGRDDIRAMLIGALGCNLAWGLIDGVFYLMGTLAEKGKNLATLRAVRAAEPGKARKIITAALPSTFASVLTAEEVASLDQRLKALPEPPEKSRLDGRDWRGAVGVFLLVFLCTFPVVVPFIFMQKVQLAMRVSNLIAMGMLFLAGIAYGRSIGRRSWFMGIAMIILGGLLVGITIALGG